ncbi:MAG: hypothetical protein IKL07_00480 [Clostridium sp.]|nr:hypothetical protein [Clostridium sp.]
MQKQIIYKNEAHKDFYNKKIMEYAGMGRTPDSYVKPLFYLLAISDDTRRNFDNLYNMQSNSIKPEGLRGGWLTGSTKKICLLAYNLFNGRTQDGRTKVSDELTPYNLFATDCAQYFVQAIVLRYPSYFAKKEEI